MAAPLPEFVPPMLAQLGEPFDADDRLYEIKWDGTRALAFIEAGAYRLRNRRNADLEPRYPELAPLAALPSGTLLDGEIVVIDRGKPDFGLVMGREHARSPAQIERLARSTPVTYAVFDIVYLAGVDLSNEPLISRRAALADLLAKHAPPHVLFSDGVIGGGVHYYEEACARELEGVVAKRLSSPYRSSQRTDDWVKMKRSQTITCAIIGYVPDGTAELRSLIIAAEEDGALRCVGKVGSGLRAAMRTRILALANTRFRTTPLVPCEFDGRWLEPGLFCTVSFLEKTKAGNLRAPVFLELFAEGT